jgi:hypothetical protein
MRKHKTGFYCEYCHDHTSVVTKGPNHILHIILSFLTGGFWLIVYAMVAIGSSNATKRCVKCGHVVNLARV